MRVELTLNGAPTALECRSDEMLLDVLRREAGLTSVRETCRIGVCGACTVLVDDAPISGCLMLAALAAGRRVTTVEGLGGSHPVQRAFVQEHAFQCGYCTSGFVLTAKALLEETADPSEEEIAEALGGNLCRCGSYRRIIAAVRRAAAERPANRGAHDRRAIDRVSDRESMIVPEEADKSDELRRFRLDGRVVLVTGGYGGIGSRLCEALAGVGARVVVIGRDAARARAAAEEIAQRGGEALAAVADVTKRAEVDAAVDAAVERFGRVDGLVTTVGGGAGDAIYPAESYPEDAWDWIMDLNLRSALLPAQAAARAMISGGRGGHILHVSSVRGQLGIHNGFSAYVAAKGALNALTRQQATEWAQHAITVNAISPTFVRTPQVAGLLSDTAFREGLERRIPLGRIAETDDLVGPALLLCSDASSFITGQVLTLDGGLTACQ